MRQNDRVLARRGARELSVQEIEAVSGAMHTNVACLTQATATLTTVDLDGTTTDMDSTH